MTTRAAIIWLAIAVVLAVGAALTGRSGTRGRDGLRAPELLLPASINETVSLRLSSPGREAIEFEMEPTEGVWLLRQAGGIGWPVEPGRIPALLRVLSGTTGTVEPTRVVSDDATVLEFRGRGEEAIASLRVDRDSLAGRTLVEVIEPAGSRTVLVDDAIKRAIAGAGPLSWRDRRVFPGLPSDPARITIRMPTHTIELARQSGAWGLRSPVAARADGAAVAGVIRAMQSMEMTRFIEEGSVNESTPFPESTEVALVAEADGIDPSSGERWTMRWMLDLGGVAPKGGAFVARLRRTVTGSERAPFGPVLAELSNDRLATVPAAAEAYIARTVLNVAPTDVGLVRLTMPEKAEEAFRRRASGWTAPDPSGAAASVDVVESDRRQLDALVAVLCEARADHVAILPGEDSLPGGLGVELLGLSEQPLETCRVFVDDSGERTQLIVRTGRVTRAYFVSGELAEWLLGR